MSTTPTLAQLIRVAVEDESADLHVAFPARILSYASASQLAVVQPATRIHIGDPPIPTSLPPISDCPVLWPSGSGYALSLDLLPGDDCLVVCCSHDLDAWLTSGGADVLPTSKRRHSLTDAVVIPGLRPRTRPLAQAALPGAALGRDDGSVELRLTEAEAVITSPTIRLGSAAAADPVVLESLNATALTRIRAWATLVEAAINAIAPGTFVPGVTSLFFETSHVPPSTAATKVKGE